jgi:hypothetical protein
MDSPQEVRAPTFGGGAASSRMSLADDHPDMMGGDGSIPSESTLELSQQSSL